jgi:hypothetical protein
MTLLVGILCQDGAVVAADKQTTHGGSGTMTVGHATTKVMPIKNKALLVSSGYRGLGIQFANALEPMRESMFKDQTFEAGVFIGGMEGIIEEFDLFTKLQPDAKLLPIASTGGAAIDLVDRLKSPSPDLRNDLDYVSLFHRRLSIAPRELRYDRPSSQPSKREDRLWVPRTKERPA